MAILIIFLSYGLLPLTTYNTIPHSLKFDTERIKIEFLEEENEESKLKDKIIFYSDLIKIKRNSEFLILFFKNPVKGVLLIPFISLKDKTELEVLFNNLSESLTPIEQPA